MQLEDLVLSLLNARTQLHVWHWQTTSLAQHKALGKLYEACGDIADRMMESWMGNNERPQFQGVEMDDLGDYESVEQLDKYLNLLANNLTSLQGVTSDILNMRDELLGEVNKTRYLLTLE